MLFLILGLALLAIKLLAWGPGAEIPWWGVGGPFVLAVAWWYFADRSGYTSSKAMAREQREVNRRRMQRVKMQERKSPRRR